MQQAAAMSDDEIQVEIQAILQHLEDVSYVARRDAGEALPTIEPFGLQTQLDWLEAARALFFHDREAGKAFMRGSPALAGALPEPALWMGQARGFTAWVNAGDALQGFMQQAASVYQAWGRQGEERWYEWGMAWCRRSLADGTAYFQTDFRTLAGEQGPAGLEAILAPVEQLFQERRLGLAVYLEGALTVRDRVGVDAVEPWARRGADIMQSGHQRGEAYFRLESEQSLKVLLEAIPGFRPRQHSRLLQLILAGWFGEAPALDDGEWRPGHGRPMVETDGQRLYLPAVLADHEEAILAVLHTAGHLRFDTYSREAIESLFRELGMEHPPLDADQRITWRPLFAAYGERMFRFQVLFDLCEDLRVDARLDGLIPRHARRLLGRARRAEPPAEPAATYFRFAQVSLERLVEGEPQDERLQPLLRADADLLTAFRIAGQLFEDPAFPEIGPRQRSDAYLPGRSLNTARAVYPRTRPGMQPEEAELEGLAERPQSEKQRPEEAVEPPNDPGSPDMDVPPEDTSGSGGRVGVGKAQPAQVVGGRRAAREPNQDGVAYPEWDYREQRYITEWARVHERALQEQEPERAERILSEHAGVLKRLRRALEMQRPTRPAPLRRQREGEELDLEATVAYVAEKRAGLSPKPFIYTLRSRRQRDTAALLLADMSTSIMANHPSGQGKVVDRLRAGLMVFAEAMHQVGDPYGIDGFASKYHDNVNYYRIKDFSEAMGPVVRGRIAAVSGRLASRMGAAIRHAIERFRAAPAQQRLLLILSDGRPADYDDGGDARYLHEDTRMAMKEAVDAGIHPFCVTLDPSGSDYLPAIFGPGHYTVIDNVDDLPARLPEIYLRLTRG